MTRWVALVLAIAAAAPAAADSTAASATATATATTPPPPPSKKDQLLFAKTTTRAELKVPPPRLQARLVNLYNTWTHEWLALDATGRDAPPTAEVDHFLRCHYTNEGAAMDPRLVKVLLAAAAHFHTDTIDIVSGFRHPKYNLMLRKKGHQVARDSQHTHGNAVDFYIPGVTTRALHAWAVSQRLGGVGMYLASGFVHMDVGAIRYWNGD